MESLQSSFHVCIVGAGIVGLAGGIFFRQRGFKVTIIEKNPDLQHIGAGVQLHPNALRVLKDLDVYADVKAKSALAPAIILKDYATGKTLHKQDLGEIEELYGAPVLTVHRAHLRQILYEKALAAGVHFEFGFLVKADASDLARGTVSLYADTCSSSSSPFKAVSADLFVGADGANSALRKTLTGHKAEAIPHGKLVYRIVLDEKVVRARESLRHLVESPNIIVWMGPESQTVTYSLAGDFNIAITRPSSLDPADVFFGQQAVDVKGFQAELAAEGWDREVCDLVGLSEDCKRWMLFQPQIDDERSPWVDGEAKLCIIGDAAHRTLPYLAQGAAMGLESISTLAHLLGKAQYQKQVKDCLDVYQRLRKDRTGHVTRAALKMGAIWQLPNGPLKEERDRIFRCETPTAGYPNLLADPFLQIWLWGYDAPQAADVAWERHLHSPS